MKKTPTFTLAEPEAVREIHAVRRRIQRRAEKIGWVKYLEEINSRPSLVAEPEPLALRERPGKDYNSK
jgi:hypothetical protein